MFAILILAAALFAVAAEAPAVAGYPPVDPPVRTRPGLVRVPTLDEIADFYPRAARARGIAGKAVLDCRVAVEGRLKDCVTYQETPAGMGFGDVALELAPLISMRPGTINGVPIVDERVRVPMEFRIPGGPLPGLDETLRCYGLFSAHLILSPDDARLARAVSLAGLRADALMTDMGVDSTERSGRLTAARSAAPRPRYAGATNDSCFGSFLD